MNNRTINQQTQKIIKDIKLIRERDGVSYQEIANRTEANGEPVSISTIKNVFSDKVTHNHSYEHVIKPIARALQHDRNNDADYELLEARLALKEIVVQQQQDLIAELKERLQRKDTKHKEREDLYIEQISFYRDQIRFKDEQIVRYQANIDRKDAALRKWMVEDNVGD